jgi:hypothetical protein
MTRHRLKGVIGAFVAGSLMLSSAGAAATTSIPVQQDNPWAVLSAMSAGAPAAAVCGAAVAAAAAQAPTGCVLPALDAAPAAAPVAPAPVPPVAAPSGGLGISPLLLGLLVVAAGVGIYFAVHHHHHNEANSPA